MRKKFGGVRKWYYLCSRKTKMVAWMSGLVTGLQNRAQRFESACDLTIKALIPPRSQRFFRHITNDRIFELLFAVFAVKNPSRYSQSKKFRVIRG